MWWLININFSPQSSAVFKTKLFVKIFSHKTFLNVKTLKSKIDLSLKKVQRSNLDHHLVKLGNTCPNKLKCIASDLAYNTEVKLVVKDLADNLVLRKRAAALSYKINNIFTVFMYCTFMGFVCIFLPMFFIFVG